MTLPQEWIDARRAEIDAKNRLEALPANVVQTTAWHNFVAYEKG